ncbi:hypothetical protein B296_00029458 [Ensete ventricosum]|uniref:RING-CH-type domain-containing protein n=1 Tax=Ensete ventricosum TaxID=4639 RepID=A0A427ADS2_ENSVE|nr:hypothetical protein B296_00029458 [Ensete ventricosum]
MRGEPQMSLDEENIPNDSDPLIQRQIESSQPPEGLEEIKDEEADAASCACCRICLENESFPGDELISPCMCKGTQQFVHRSCLDHWRSVKANLFRLLLQLINLFTYR